MPGFLFFFLEANLESFHKTLNCMLQWNSFIHENSVLCHVPWKQQYCSQMNKTENGTHFTSDVDIDKYFNCISTLVTKYLEEIQPRGEWIRVHDHLDCRIAPLLRLPFFSHKISDRVYTKQYSPHLEVRSTDQKKEQAHLAARFNHIVNNLMLLLLKMWKAKK